MYPANFYAAFPAFPVQDRVFVAMSFAPAFTARWEKVILPAVQAIEFNGKPLEAHRLDQRTIGDSILTEILDSIGKSRLVLADITSLATLNDKVMRSDNVMYEVGIAHAIRQPAEVVLFRSDNEQLLFDMANVRVNTYNPDGDPAGARKMVADTLAQALKEVDLMQNLTGRRAAETLDPHCLSVLIDALNGGIAYPIAKTPNEMLSVISRASALTRLLANGMLQTILNPVTAEMLTAKPELEVTEIFRFQLTPFGNSVLELASMRMGYCELAAKVKAGELQIS